MPLESFLFWSGRRAFSHAICPQLSGMSSDFRAVWLLGIEFLAFLYRSGTVTWSLAPIADLFGLKKGEHYFPVQPFFQRFSSGETATDATRDESSVTILGLLVALSFSAAKVPSAKHKEIYFGASASLLCALLRSIASMSNACDVDADGELCSYARDVRTSSASVQLSHVQGAHAPRHLFDLDGTYEGAAGAALSFATVVASVADESQFVPNPMTMPFTILDVSVSPHKETLHADWKHKVAVGLLRDRKDATGNQATKLDGVEESETAALLVRARPCFAGFTSTLVVSSEGARLGLPGKETEACIAECRRLGLAALLSNQLISACNKSVPFCDGTNVNYVFLHRPHGLVHISL